MNSEQRTFFIVAFFCYTDQGDQDQTDQTKRSDGLNGLNPKDMQIKASYTIIDLRSLRFVN